MAGKLYNKNKKSVSQKRILVIVKSELKLSFHNNIRLF